MFELVPALVLASVPAKKRLVPNGYGSWNQERAIKQSILTKTALVSFPVSSKAYVCGTFLLSLRVD